MDYNTNFPRLQEANEKMFKKIFAQPKRGKIAPAAFWSM